MKRIAPLLTAVTTVLAVIAASAQVPERSDSAAFEAASIKPSPATVGPMLLSGTSFQDNRWTATRTTLLGLIRNAYGSTYRMREQIVGGPPWADTDRFDITAVAQGRPTRDQFAAMVRTLLADRFKLLVHVESRELPILALVLARNDRRHGPSLREVSVDCEPYRQAFARGERPSEPPVPNEARPCDSLMRASGGTVRLSGRALSIAELARLITSPTGPMVVDRTGLTGLFDFDFEYVPESALRADAGAAQQDGPRLAEALEGQLGLKLERGRALVDVLVIERADRPTSD